MISDADRLAIRNEIRERELSRVLQRLSTHADSLSVEIAFTAGWDAKTDYLYAVELAERDAHSEANMDRNTVTLVDPWTLLEKKEGEK